MELGQERVSSAVLILAVAGMNVHCRHTSHPSLEALDGRRWILLIRHGLSVANTQKDVFFGSCDERFIDAGLSPVGRRQAEALSPVLEAFKPDLILSSPMRRAIQTCMLALEGSPSSPPIVLHPTAMECAGEGHENEGRVVEQISQDVEFQCFAHWRKVNLQEMPDGAWWEEERERIKQAGGRKAQARSLVSWLKHRSERKIAVFTHWGLVEAFSGRSASNGGPMIDFLFAPVDPALPPRKWDWFHARKRD
uniref:Histidine phosphatase family protein n=1 Tax=Guillardia theta TaxID=55529 RepID=A0A6U5YYN4_GUITH|mmetsp:Transcript_23773/g.77388  ORF Transcript_23773/g.77388 Transcript_23773/m.77388 type:complete len:251 (+) Transcript_23773:691-1443(+)